MLRHHRRFRMRGSRLHSPADCYETAIGKSELDLSRIQRVDPCRRRHSTSRLTDGADVVLVAPNTLRHGKLPAMAEQLVLRPVSHPHSSMLFPTVGAALLFSMSLDPPDEPFTSSRS